LNNRVAEAKSMIASSLAEATEKVKVGRTLTVAEVNAAVEVCVDQANRAEASVKSIQSDSQKLNDFAMPAVASLVKKETARFATVFATMNSSMKQLEAKTVTLRDIAKLNAKEELARLESAVQAVARTLRIDAKQTEEEFFGSLKTERPDGVTLKDFVGLFSKQQRSDGENFAVADLERLYHALDEESEGMIPKAAFCNLLRTCMLVTQVTMMTDEFLVSAGKPLKRADIGDIVDVLEGPTMEDASKVERIRCERRADGTVGWMTTVGNQGTTFAVGTSTEYVVVKETILTDAFAIESKPTKDKSRSFAHKLKPGDKLEVLQWPMKDSFGLARIKCKNKTTADIGWVTVKSNSGNIFLKPAVVSKDK